MTKWLQRTSSIVCAQNGQPRTVLVTLCYLCQSAHVALSHGLTGPPIHDILCDKNGTATPIRTFAAVAGGWPWPEPLRHCVSARAPRRASCPRELRPRSFSWAASASEPHTALLLWSRHLRPNRPSHCAQEQVRPAGTGDASHRHAPGRLLRRALAGTHQRAGPGNCAACARFPPRSSRIPAFSLVCGLIAAAGCFDIGTFQPSPLLLSLRSHCAFQALCHRRTECT